MLARILILMLIAFPGVALAACGEDAADESVESLLQQTFTGDKQVDSGRLALEVTAEVQGSQQLRGPLSLELSGPFQRRGADELPAFDLAVSATGMGITYEAGVVSTGDQGFVRFQGEDYVLSDEVFEQFRRGFEQGRAERSSGGDPTQQLATLGIDPRKWLTNATNEGESEVGGTETIRIIGGVDVPGMVEDLAQAGERARALDPQASGELPDPLTEAEREEIARSLRDVRVEIHTGAEDKILRRIVVTGRLVAPEDAQEFESADLRLDYSITELNEDQDVEAPQDARPFEELAGQLQGLGLLGGGSAGDDSEPSRRELERYTRCVERADGDEAAIRDCSDLL